MAKGNKHAGGASGAAATGKEQQRQLRRLERRLAAAREIEAKRKEQAAKARDRGAPRSLLAKRGRQLEKARRREAAIEARIAALRALATPADPAATTAAAPAPAVSPAEATLDPAALSAPAAPRAYCLRERRSVDVVDPQSIVMRNGREGLSGTCPSCGARIVRPGRA